MSLWYSCINDENGDDVINSKCLLCVSLERHCSWPSRIDCDYLYYFPESWFNVIIHNHFAWNMVSLYTILSAFYYVQTLLSIQFPIRLEWQSWKLSLAVLRCIPCCNFSSSPYVINNYSPKWRWIVVDIYQATKRRGKYSPLFTDTEVNNCFSIYHTSWINSGPRGSPIMVRAYSAVDFSGVDQALPE